MFEIYRAHSTFAKSQNPNAMIAGQAKKKQNSFKRLPDALPCPARFVNKATCHDLRYICLGVLGYNPSGVNILFPSARYDISVR
jgi:hypothetical protein